MLPMPTKPSGDEAIDSAVVSSRSWELMAWKSSSGSSISIIFINSCHLTSRSFFGASSRHIVNLDRE